MIRVAVHSGNSFVDVDVDADDVSILGPDKNTGGLDVLVLEKNGKEVAWFSSWAYAVKEEADVS